MITEFLYNEQLMSMLKTALVLGAAVGIYGVLIILKRDSLALSVLSTSTFLSSIVIFMIFGSLSTYKLLTLSSVMGAFSILLLLLIQQGSTIARGIAKSILASIFFGVAIALLTYIDRNIKGVSLNFSQYLLGDIFLLNENMYDAIFSVSLAVLLISVLLKRQFQLFLFNKSFLNTESMKERILSIIFYVTLSFLVYLTNQIVGVVLTPALFIIPALASEMLAKSFYSLIAIAAFIAIVSLFFGGILSQNIAFIPSGTTIIFVAGVLALMILFFAPTDRGILIKYIAKRRARAAKEVK